jgi:hypothetical protein
MALDLIDQRRDVVVVDEIDESIGVEFETPIARASPWRFSSYIARQEPQWSPNGW